MAGGEGYPARNAALTSRPARLPGGHGRTQVDVVEARDLTRRCGEGTTAVDAPRGVSPARRAGRLNVLAALQYESPAGRER